MKFNKKRPSFGSNSGGSNFKKNRPDARPSRFSKSKPARNIKNSRAPKVVKTVKSAEDDGRVRLNKYLADRGVGSRRGCDEVIQSGSVSVNGEIVTELGVKVDPESDRIEVNGQLLKEAARVTFALNKPRGVVCTSAPQETRPRAIDLVRDARGTRLYCIGRLDMDSEGLILLTNDGEFANRVAHPRYQVTKSYFVKVKGQIDAAALESIRKGVWLAEGRTQGAKVFVRKKLSQATILIITVREGMNREIRRIFAKLGYSVEHLKRVAIGNISVRGLGRGKYRKLDPGEIRGLMESSSASAAGTAANADSPDEMPDDLDGGDFDDLE